MSKAPGVRGLRRKSCETVSLSLPQFNRLIESSFVRDKRSVSNVDVTVIPLAGTVEDSVLRTEMTVLESPEEDVPKRILFFKPMSWLGQIRSHRRDETWSVSL